MKVITFWAEETRNRKLVYRCNLCCTVTDRPAMKWNAASVSGDHAKPGASEWSRESDWPRGWREVVITSRDNQGSKTAESDGRAGVICPCGGCVCYLPWTRSQLSGGCPLLVLPWRIIIPCLRIEPASSSCGITNGTRQTITSCDLLWLCDC